MVNIGYLLSSEMVSLCQGQIIQLKCIKSLMRNPVTSVRVGTVVLVNIKVTPLK